MAVSTSNGSTITDCNCICNQCNCQSVVVDLQQQIAHLKTSKKSLEEKYVQIQHDYENLKQSFEELLDLEDYNDGPYQPSSQQSLRKKISRSTSSSSHDEDSENDDSNSDDEKSSKKGRKKGHKGSTKILEPTTTVYDYVDQCKKCGKPFDLADQQSTGGYQEVEIPFKILLEIIQHITHQAVCSDCNVKTKSSANLKGTIFGPNTVAFLTDLWYTGVVSLDKVAEIFKNLTTEGFDGNVVQKATKVAARAVEEEVEQYKDEVRKHRHPHIDETSYPIVKDDRSLGWIFVVATDNEVFFEFRPDRKAGFLKEFWGKDLEEIIPVIDGWLSYNFFENLQRCWAHIIIEIKYLSNKKNAPPVAKLVEKKLRTIHHDLTYTKDLGKGENTTILERARKRLTKTIELLKGSKNTEMQKFHTKLVNAAPYLLTAMEFKELKFDNNLAERLLRHLVLMRKTRGKVASDQGAKDLVTLASFYETCKLRGVNPRERLLQLLYKACNRPYPKFDESITDGSDG